MMKDPICCASHIDTAPPPRQFGLEMVIEKPSNSKFFDMTDMSGNSVDQHKEEPLP